MRIFEITLSFATALGQILVLGTGSQHRHYTDLRDI